MKVLSELFAMEKAGLFQEALDQIRLIFLGASGETLQRSVNLELLERRLRGRLLIREGGMSVSLTQPECLYPSTGTTQILNRTVPEELPTCQVLTTAVQESPPTRFSRLSPEVDGWTREFSHGSIDCQIIGEGYVTVFRVTAGRDYLSKQIELLPDFEYVVSIECAGLSGNPRDILAVLCPEPLEGNTVLSSHFIHGSGWYTVAFKTGSAQTLARLRVGVGVTAPCESAAEIQIKQVEITFQKGAKNNRTFLDEYLHKYIDPELLLPPLVGIGNDYGHITDKRNLIIAKAGWEELTISIIVPVTGNIDLLDKTLASICAQTYPKKLIEVVIIDDGSNEDIGEIFLKYAKKLNLYWARLSQHQPGLAAAKNMGAKASRSDVLYFIDSETILTPTIIKDVMSYYHATNNIAILTDQRLASDIELTQSKVLRKKCRSADKETSNQREKYSDVLPLNNKMCEDWYLPHLEKTDWLKNDDNPFLCLGCGQFAVSREAYVTAGGFEESFEEPKDEDIEFAYRLMTNGSYFIPLHENLAFHQKDDKNVKVLGERFARNINPSTQLQERCPHFLTREYESGKQYKVPQISVYVPAYNTGNYIRQAIQSVLDQTYNDYEIVVVDDGSTDNTWEVLKANFGDSQRIHLHQKGNGGIGSASNFALRRCRGYLVVQLDSDDVLDKNALAFVADFFRRNPQIDCIYSKFDLIDKNGNYLKSGWAPPKFDRYESLVGMNIPHMRCFKRSMYSRSGGFDERIENAVDYDFYLKMSNVARISHLNEVLYQYRIHRAQTSTAKRAIQAMNHVVVVNKYLQSLGLDDFVAEKLDPTDLHANYIYRKGGFFANTVSNKTFTQVVLPAGLPLDKPSVTGNDYSYIQDFVREYYKNHKAEYSQSISIVIPVYNRAERLSRCLAGLFHQTYPRNLMELVVVDDGSSDGVLEVIKKYQKYFQLKYIKQADDGYRLSAARNLGIRSASHQNINIIDCDLIPLPNFIESFMQYLHHFDNVVLLGHQRFIDPTGTSDDDILGDVRVLNSFDDIVAENTTMAVNGKEEGPTRDWRYALYEQTDTLRTDEFPYRAFSSGHVAYKKEAIERAGYYDEEFNIWGCEDNEAGYRLYNQGYVFIPVLEAIDLHQEPPTGKNETDREKDRLISREMLKAKCPAVRDWFGTPYKRKTGDVPLISICIPVFNCVEYVQSAIDSALLQTFTDIEVIVFDDCSTDGSYELVKDMNSENHAVRILKGAERRNVTFARNELLRAARGEFVGFLDADDIMESTCLAECLNAFRGKPGIGLVCTGYSKIDERGAPLGAGWTPPDFTRQGMLFGNIFTHFRMFRIRDWHRSAKWSKEEIEDIFYGEDWDLCLKLSEVTEFARVDKPLYRYRVRSTSITRSNNNRALAKQTRLIARSILKRRAIEGIGVDSTYPDTHPHMLGYYRMF
jgi:chondroitin synthase